MKGIFSDRTFMLLFCAQVLGLLGNGVTIIGLAYFSFEIAGDKASALIGLFYILKMLAFIVVAPFSTNFNRAGSKAAMIGLYLLRAGVVLFLPFSESIWQAVILVIFMHGATAAFVPLMQTVLSDVFSDEGRFTAALGMTRLSYSMEQLVSPLIVSMLLLAVGPFNIFFFAFAGFTVAALILSCAVVPSRPAVIAGPSPWRSTLEGVQIYLATPRLRGRGSRTISRSSPASRS